MSEAILLGALSIVGFMLLALFIALKQTDLGGGNIQFIMLGMLQIILIGFVLGIIVMIGKVGVESYDHCSWVVSNSTTSGSSSVYSYDYLCEPNLNSTASGFYKMTLWIMRLVVLYMFLAFAFETIQFFGEQKRNKINGEE